MESIRNYHLPILRGIAAHHRLECRTSSQDLNRVIVVVGFENQIMTVTTLVRSIRVEDFNSRLGEFSSDGSGPAGTIDRANQDDGANLASEPGDLENVRSFDR